jgi:LAS superfamily LD-carboxypeptidase LdcB
LAGCQAASPIHDRDPGGEGATTATTATADGIIDASDGVLPAGVSVLDDSYPGVARLAPDLLEALRLAAADAGADGVAVHVASGWRSAEYQDQLLREAIVEHGSAAEAARWVATAETSAHVSGDAVDIGPYDAISWMQQHGEGYGLCQIYGNEAWHYELVPEAVEEGCPPPYTDPTQDPRLHG